MYALTFKVRAWLEEPAKWLRWAMQSPGKPKDQRWNLQKFWESLTRLKPKAQNPLDWAEVLDLDAKSQWLLGNLYQQDASDLLKSMNSTRLWSSTVFALKHEGYKAKLRTLDANAARAFQRSEELSGQAKAAYTKAGQTNQAEAVTHVAQASRRGARAVAANNLHTAEQIGKGTNLFDALSVNFLGLPVWAWGAGGLAIWLALSAGPTVALVSSARRRA